MNNFPVSKFVSIAPPAAIIDNAALATASFKTDNAKYVVISAYIGACDIAATVCKVQHSDTDGSYTDISGSDLVASFTDAADNQVIRWYIRVSKKWMDVAITLGNGAAGTYICAWADLYMDELPSDNTELGVLASAFLQP